jgi:hypothetical protein
MPCTIVQGVSFSAPQVQATEPDPTTAGRGWYWMWFVDRPVIDFNGAEAVAATSRTYYPDVSGKWVSDSAKTIWGYRIRGNLVQVFINTVTYFGP